jgi:hypothetical protein
LFREIKGGRIGERFLDAADEKVDLTEQIGMGRDLHFWLRLRVQLDCDAEDRRKRQR